MSSSNETKLGASGRTSGLIIRQHRDLIVPIGPQISNNLNWTPTPKESQILDRTMDRNHKYRQYAGLPTLGFTLATSSNMFLHRFPGSPLSRFGLWRRFNGGLAGMAVTLGAVFGAAHAGRALSVWKGYQEIQKLSEQESVFVQRSRGSEQWGLWHFNLGVMFAWKVEESME